MARKVEPVASAATPIDGFKTALCRPFAGGARIISLALSFAVVVGIASSKADDPSRNADAKTAILDYYPAKARAAGVEGTAALKCDMTERHALQGCSLVSESPKGWGFGAAAMALAQHAKENIYIVSPAAPGPITFVFSLHPPAILPDVLDSEQQYIAPVFVKRPDLDQSEMAKIRWMIHTNGQNGRVILDCVVGLDQKLSDCSVVGTSDSGLSKIALQWASTLALRPMTIDGKPQGGAHVILPLSLYGG
jgi:hypothetical protein